jgi:hypothetical protein
MVIIIRPYFSQVFFELQIMKLHIYFLLRKLEVNPQIMEQIYISLQIFLLPPPFPLLFHPFLPLLHTYPLAILLSLLHFLRCIWIPEIQFR